MQLRFTDARISPIRLTLAWLIWYAWHKSNSMVCYAWYQLDWSDMLWHQPDRSHTLDTSLTGLIRQSDWSDTLDTSLIGRTLLTGLTCLTPALLVCYTWHQPDLSFKLDTSQPYWSDTLDTCLTGLIHLTTARLVWHTWHQPYYAWHSDTRMQQVSNEILTLLVWLPSYMYVQTSTHNHQQGHKCKFIVCLQDYTATYRHAVKVSYVKGKLRAWQMTLPFCIGWERSMQVKFTAGGDFPVPLVSPACT